MNIRNNINNYFIGGLLENAKAFDVARVKLVYNFTLFYYFMNLLGCIMLIKQGAYIIGFSWVVIVLTFTISILTLLRKQKLLTATLFYLSMHVVIGSLIFFTKKAEWSFMDGGMIVVLIAFAMLTLGRKRGFLWVNYLFVMIGISIAQEVSEGKVLTYESPGMPPDPTAMILIPMVLLIYILWVYLKSKDIAEVTIEEQKILLQNQYTEISDSIAYAKRIQTAILPPDNLRSKLIPNSFIYYKPKAVVAGDFYWIEPTNAGIYFAAADCTGHGVPGAMVSVVCNAALNRSAREFELTSTGQILNKARELVIQEFEKSEEEVKDGMDIALCKINGNTLSYSGANNPLWIINTNRTEWPIGSTPFRNMEGGAEIKPDKQAIGKIDNPKPFTTHQFELQKGDSIYIFSDGFQDQFGGEKGKKFSPANFKNLLLSIHSEPMEKQKVIIDEAFEKWKGNEEQVDDVCVIGIKIEY
jgi:serine phosphatase RsbU (regulator of sigma subunit)